MANNWKYTLEKHKKKIIVGGGVVTTAVLAGGIYFLVTGDKPFGGTEEYKSSVVKEYLTTSPNGSVQLMNVKDQKMITDYKADGENVVYHPVYHGGNVKLIGTDGVSFYKVEVDGEKLTVTKEAVPASGKVDNVKKVFGTDKAIAYVSDKNEIYYYEFGSDKLNQHSLKADVDDASFFENGFMYTAGDFLYTFEDGVLDKTELGDVSPSILEKGKSGIVIHNRFGSTKEENIVIQYNPIERKIGSLGKVGASDTEAIDNLSSSKEFFTAKRMDSNSSEPYTQLTKWSIKENGKFEKDNIPLKIELGKDGVAYNEKTSVAYDNFLYTNTVNKMKIYDLQGQKAYKDITLDEDMYAYPVIDEGKGDAS